MGCVSSKPAAVQHSSPLQGRDTSAYTTAKASNNSAPAASKSGPANTSPASPSKKPKATRPAFTGEAALKHNKGKCSDHYVLGRLLGKGGFAKVVHARHRDTGDRVAVKIMAVVSDRQQAGSNDNTWEDVIAEIDILCRLDHPNIISLNEFFIEDNCRVLMVTNLVQGGELLDAVLKAGSYSEATARQCFKQLLEAIAYCHSHRVVHRDLKLENLLLERPHDITQIRVVDFGLAKGHADTEALSMKTVCGTPHYVAPEVIAGKKGHRYGPEVDLWSAGVILFILLSGNPPFYHKDDKQLYKLICKGAFSFQDPIWDLVSKEGKDLIQKLLVIDASKRLSAQAALTHPWITGMSEDEMAANKLSGAVENMKQWRGMRKAVHTVVAGRRMSAAAQAVQLGTAQSGCAYLTDSGNIRQAVEAAKRAGVSVDNDSKYYRRSIEAQSRSLDSASTSKVHCEPGSASPTSPASQGGLDETLEKLAAADKPEAAHMPVEMRASTADSDAKGKGYPPAKTTAGV